MTDTGRICRESFVLDADHVSFGVSAGGLYGVSGVVFNAEIRSETAYYSLMCSATWGFPDCAIEHGGDFLYGQTVTLVATGAATVGQWWVEAAGSPEPD